MTGLGLEHFSLEKSGTFLGSYQVEAEEEKDSLLFHGVPWGGEEKGEEEREELEEKIRELIRTEYGVECTQRMDTVCRLN